MKLSTKAEKILTQITDKSTKLGDIRTIAKGIKKGPRIGNGTLVIKTFFCPTIGNLDYGQETSNR